MKQMWTVAAPSGRLVVQVSLTDAGALQYSAQYAGEELVGSSRLGLDLRPGGYVACGMELVSAKQRRRDEKFPILAGKCSEGHDHCNTLTLELQQGEARLAWEFRVFNDGFAFRYTITASGGVKSVDVVAERTEFRFPANHRCWAMELPHFQSSFESEFHPRRLGDLRSGQLIGCPLTIQTESGLGIAITEAGLHDHAGMYLEGLPGSATSLISRLAPRMDGSYASVHAKPPHASPWRVVQIAENPAKLIESNILYCLNEPCAVEDTSWIRPGRVVWDWWNGHAPSGKVQRPGMNNETMIDHIDFAAEMGAQYMLIDGGWYGPSHRTDSDPTKARKEIDLPMLVQYANRKGVEIMVWIHQMDLKQHLDRAFAFYASLNIKGVKVDFFDRDDQEMVQWAHDIVIAAAKHKLLVDLHGIFKPTGMERTYPNLLTHEGVMGAEYNKWSSRITPEHNVTIPFTRMLAGPMDYTPGAFNNATKEQFRPRNVAPMVMGTRCHNLAMYVVYQSGLQMISDYPDAIRGQRGSEFLKVVPAAWDETIAIAGEVGKYIVIARRKGADWFLGAMTNSEKRTIEIPLSFLGDGAYTATVFEDGANAASDPTSVMIREMPARRSGTIVANLAPAGGLAASFAVRPQGPKS